MPLNSDDIAHVISVAIKAATAPLLARIAVLEAKGFPSAVVGEKGEPGPAGKDAAVDLDALVLRVAELIPVPKDGTNGMDGAPGPAGKDAEVDLDALALKAAELIPVPKDGNDGMAPDVEDVAKLAALLIPTPKDGAPGPAGASVDPAEIEAMVTKAVAALPAPKDGQSVTVEDVSPLIAEEVEKAVKALPVPRDGVGVAGALIDKDGLLVLTLSDGTMKALGLVVGRDGERGETGIPGDPGAMGIDGKDGTLENIVPVLDERTLSFQHKDGTPLDGWSVKLPMLLDRGVYSSERAYETGDVVTYGGSAWIAKADSHGRQPGTNDGAEFWRLAVKRGNDGKPGIPGAKGLDGKPGAQGRDGSRGY